MSLPTASLRAVVPARVGGRCRQPAGLFATTVGRLLPPPSFSIDVVDPTDARAAAAVSAYFAELDLRFHGGFDAGNALADDAPAYRSDAGGGFLLAVVEGDVAGCGAFQRIDASTAEIKRMWVHPQWRGLGVARRLLVELERHAALAGARLVVLDTNAVLVEAIALYESSGYAPTERYNDNPYAQRWFAKAVAPE